MFARPRRPLELRAIRRLALHTQGTPFRPIWAGIYRAAFKTATAYITRGCSDASVYVRGSMATGDAVYGVSDIDVVVVVRGDEGRARAERDAMSRRYERLGRVLRMLPRLVRVNLYEDAELDDLIRRPILTCGLDPAQPLGSGPSALFYGRHALNDHYAARVRPGLYGPMSDWRLSSGRDRRPAAMPSTAAARATAAWLELQCWWRYAFLAAADPDAITVPLLCNKLVAESARTWLWLAHGERVEGRQQALARTLALLPEEEETLRAAAAAARRPWSLKALPLSEALAALHRMSDRCAPLVTSSLAGPGLTEVRILPVGPGELLAGNPATGAARLGRPLGVVPLADWRACVLPPRLDEALALTHADAADPVLLAAAARLEAAGGPLPALRSGDLLVLPTADPAARPLTRAALRAVQCAATDPVSFALAAGDGVAHFPQAPGWSVRDRALRAVAEHRAWLDDPAGRPATSKAVDLGLLFSAARAALLLESIEAGEPQLAPAVAAVTRALSERAPADRLMAEEAHGAYREWHLLGREPPGSTAGAFLRTVRGLPAYASRR